MTENSNRTLTDDDVEAIVDGLRNRIFTDLQLEVGRGVLVWLKKAVVMLMLVFAAYGLAHSVGDLPRQTYGH
jgi:hypothetical protein